MMQALNSPEKGIIYRVEQAAKAATPTAEAVSLRQASLIESRGEQRFKTYK